MKSYVKKVVLIIAAVLVLGMMLSGCKSDDSSDVQENVQIIGFVGADVEGYKSVVKSLLKDID